MTSSLIFEGNVEVSLYGQNALIPVSLNDELLASVVGIEGSELTVNEHRSKTIQTIRNSSSGCYPDSFLQAFNQAAWAAIYYDPDRHGLGIDLFETSAKSEMPVLWMGTLENNLTRAYEVEWEIYKPIDENNTAFCALLKTQPVTATG